MKNIRSYIALILIAIIVTSTTGCATSVKAENLMDGISRNNVNGKSADEAFTAAIADFSIELFKESITTQENSLISPLSVTLAIAMTANGADNETLKQMEGLLGNDIPLDELNEYLYNYVSNLPDTEKSTLHIANSIWINDKKNLQFEPDFLQKNADYYNASLFHADFNKQADTVNDINNWVKSNTDGMIEEMLKELNSSVMYLVNAITFDAEWATIYDETSVIEGIFTNIHGEKQNVDFMNSNEFLYLEDGMATGFIKPYYDKKYSFVALLPNEEISIETYVESLTGDGFMNTLENAQIAVIDASMPKFEYEYEIRMIDPLTELGMIDAFDADRADFEKLAVSSEGNLFIDEFLHKTFIKVDEKGTKAGAATAVGMSDAIAAPFDDAKIVRLDRPFIYAIIDGTTNLPVFIGTVMTV